MHEFALARDLIKGALAALEGQEGERIASLHIRVGAGAQVDERALSFALKAASVDTAAADCQIYFEFASPISPSTAPTAEVILESIAVTEIPPCA